MDGLTSPTELALLAKQYNMPAVAITDHGNLFGAYKFYLACKEHGVKPIFGVEFYITGKRKIKDKKIKSKHVVLLAKNLVGWKNLIELHTASYVEGMYYKPRIDIELVSKHHEGLIAMSACISGIIAQHALKYDDISMAFVMAKWWQEVFMDTGYNEDFYMEIMPFEMEEQHILNKHLEIISEETGIKLVATADTHYPIKEDLKAHQVLLKIRNPNFKFPALDLWFRTEQEMYDGFACHEIKEQTVRKAMENTIEIANKIESFSIEPEYQIPDLSGEGDGTCWNGNKS